MTNEVKRYHKNPATGRANICKKKSCELTHFDNKEDVLRVSDFINEGNPVTNPPAVELNITSEGDGCCGDDCGCSTSSEEKDSEGKDSESLNRDKLKEGVTTVYTTVVSTLGKTKNKVVVLKKNTVDKLYDRM